MEKPEEDVLKQAAAHIEEGMMDNHSFDIKYCVGRELVEEY